MKAEIVYDDTWEEYYWVIYYGSGTFVQGPRYTRRDNAKRGLKRFVHKMITCGTYLDGEFLG